MQNFSVIFLFKELLQQGFKPVSPWLGIITQTLTPFLTCKSIFQQRAEKISYFYWKYTTPFLNILSKSRIMYATKYRYTLCTTVSFPSSELGPPPLSPRECVTPPPPTGTKGGGNTLAGGWGDVGSRIGQLKKKPSTVSQLLVTRTDLTLIRAAIKKCIEWRL
jgi:hypothetical protein